MMTTLVRNVDLTSANVDLVCRISDIGGSAKSEIDPFGIPGFYGVVTYFR